MRLLILLGILCCKIAFADTIDHYMNIAENIPKMEMNADPQAQAWARSARNVLAITCESIAETLIQSNDLARAQGGAPLFCLPPGTQLNSTTLDNLIQQTYKELSSQQSDKNKLTVSQIAWMGVRKAYPCGAQGGVPQALQNQANNQMQHIDSLLQK